MNSSSMEAFVFPQELICHAVLLMICAGHESKHINLLSNFCQDQSIVSQNNRYLAYCTKDVPRGMQTKFPSIIMKFWLISSKGQVMPPPTSFPKGWGWTQRSTWMSWRRWWSPGPGKPLERGHLFCNRIVHPALQPESLRGGTQTTSLTPPHLRSGLLTHQTSTWWTFMCVAHLRGTQTELPTKPERSWASGSRHCLHNYPGIRSPRAVPGSEAIPRPS